MKCFSHTVFKTHLNESGKTKLIKNTFLHKVHRKLRWHRNLRWHLHPTFPFCRNLTRNLSYLSNRLSV
ncbi:hypothetical protein Hanom_Chr12g01080371 [Helianthus anomalus]